MLRPFRRITAPDAVGVRRLSCALALAATAWGAVAPAHAQERDPRQAIRNLYATAAYEETLALLTHVEASGDPVLRDDVDEYRALCLLALARDADAAQAMTALVSRHPLTLDRLEERSPKFVALYQQVRSAVVPTLAAASYAAGKKHFDAGEFANAVVRFREAVSLLGSVPGGDRSELELLASGFLALAERAPMADGAAAPVDTVAAAGEAGEPPVAAVEQAPATEPAAAMASIPGGPDQAMAAEAPAAEPGRPVTPAPFTPIARLYTAADTDVAPPVALAQALPPWIPPHDLVRRRSYAGRLQVIVGVDGRVKSADVIQPSFSLYDEQVLRATREWRYQPATKRGHPVEYKRIIDYTLTGQ